MTEFVLYKENEQLKGFRVSGHSTESANDQKGKLVCSAVSSAVIMTANAITDILKIDSDITVNGGFLEIILKNPDEKSDLLIKSLNFHIKELAKEYSGTIKIINGGLH